ncbi:adhesion G-protein coupled receptor G7 isoform X2 [Rhinatrema bivittatum]|uniref:adhesion G-protein coupled receptor G7 isoform X2 n=1 Tax=Rhinatrema bivittatum TaxID=194408 RepID=UPI00112C321F|nr:adhesion G-protein coupled receptor G7 isoform X2 [Rhinatrema bivittatum]
MLSPDFVSGCANFLHMHDSIPAPTTAPPPCPCQNNGVCQVGGCLCPIEWTGTRCETANFCEKSSSHGLTFDRIVVGRYGHSRETCEPSTFNAGAVKATRLCTRRDGLPVLEDPRIQNCNESLDSLKDQLEGSPTSEEILQVASSTQLLTSQPEQLTAQNITTAAETVQKILGGIARSQEQVAAAAVATVSQILNANESEFLSESSSLDNVTRSLTKTLEDFSVDENATLLVQPNIAVQMVQVTAQDASTGILFSALRVPGNDSGLIPNRINYTTASGLTIHPAAEVQIFINVTGSSDLGRVGFVLYQNDRFFNSRTYKRKLSYSRRVISGRVANGTFNNVELAFSVPNDSSVSLSDHACVFWDYALSDWNTTGCAKASGAFGLLRCSCNHTTNFAVLMSFRPNYAYAKPLEIVSYVGCGLSILGLIINLLFHIITRLKTRKSKRTSGSWLLVNLWTSMLVFNIVFIAGVGNEDGREEEHKVKADTANTVPKSDIETVPENPFCTAVTVLLHYFLLATFVWTAAYSVQLYLHLVNRVVQQLPKYFKLMSAIGWGVPAVIIAITLGATYRVDNPLNYRQEEFCWLAALDRAGKFDITKPMLWAFLLPVGAILVLNIIIFVTVMVQVICKENKNLRSTKKQSRLKKLLTCLSMAVLLGITWSMGYFMLINQGETNFIFSLLFCIFNATQGLQVFILHTLRNPVFLKKAGEIFDRISPPKIRLYLHSDKYSMLSSSSTWSTQEHYKQLGTDSSQLSD